MAQSALTHGRYRRLLGAAPLALALLLAGCGLPQVSPDYTGLPRGLSTKNFICCHDPERYPEAFADLVLAVGQATLAKMPYPDEVPGFLVGQPEAEAAVVARARPLDILLTANKSYPGGRLVPGRYTHSSVYLGTEAELRAAGLWNTPAIQSVKDEIRAGKVFLEALRPAVRLAPASALMQSDSVVLLRPELNRAERLQAVTSLIDGLGTPFDFWFDDRTPDVVSCTELIGKSMPSLRFTIRSPYGRPAAMPDDIVAQAIRGERMSFVAQVRGLPEGGFVVEGPEGAMRDIGAFWGPPYELAAR